MLKWLKQALTANQPGLAQRVEELEDAAHAAHREINSLRLEWQDTLDKISAWSAREAARKRRAMQSAIAEEPPEMEPVNGTGTAPAGLPASREQLKNELRARLRAQGARV